jgi:hypothetical protein
MDVAQHEPELAQAPAQPDSRQHVISRVGISLTALCLLGAAVTAFVLLRPSGGNAPVRTAYPPDLVNGVLAYDVNDTAPTSYGKITETVVHISNSENSSEVDFSLTVDNSQLLPISAPSVDQFRVTNENGLEATYLGGGWHDGQWVLPQLSASAEFRFAAPPGGGMLLLEYREHAEAQPIRIAVGFAAEHPEALAPTY